MKSRSFRFQIVLWSVLVSGLVLLSFGIVAWWSLNHDRVKAIDDSLSHFGFRHASRASANADTSRMELSMLENFGEEKATKRFFAFLNGSGNVIHLSAGWPKDLDPLAFLPSSELLTPQPLLPITPPKEDQAETGRRNRPVFEPLFYTEEAAGRNYRIGAFANPEIRLIVGADLEELSGEVDSLRKAFLLAMPGALLLIGGGAWMLSRRALRSVNALGDAMRHISAEALDRRLDRGEADQEFAEIIAQYNAMLDRLERSFHQATRFSADASHELKTPLAVMRGTLERALANAGQGEDPREVYSDLLEQTDRQKAVLESLLLLTRADSGQFRISEEALDLSHSVELWLEDAGFLAEERGISVESEIEPGLVISADPNLLQQVAHNLFSNAVRHNVDGGRINCRLAARDDQIVWEISNTGPLIPDSERKEIFDRFLRGSNARGGGSGLGLSLVREILLAHRGRISVRSEKDCNVFRVDLPKISSL